MKLQEVCSYVVDKIDNSTLNINNYISTENMTPNCGGVTSASNVPDGKSIWFKEGDILFSNIRPYFKKLWKADISGGCSADVLCIRANEKINPTYLYYLLIQDSFISYVMKGTKGCKMPRGDKKYNMAWDIDLPSLEVQKRIADQLSEIDEKIAVNKKICENLEAQAQALFKHWFVDFAPFKDGNFCANREQNETCFNSAEVQPKITGKACKFVESELGLIPEGWRVKRLGEMPLTVTDYVANGSFASLKENVKLYEDVNYAYFIRNTDLKSKNFCVYVDEHSYNFLSKSKLEGGEIIISNVGDVGSVHLCPHLDKPMTLGNNIIMVKPNNDFYRNFLFILFRWNYGQKLIQSIKGGSAQPKFNKTDFKSLKIIVPEESVLKEFNEIVSPLFNYIGKTDKENQELSTLRDTLLPKLMSGQININEIEKSL